MKNINEFVKENCVRTHLYQNVPPCLGQQDTAGWLYEFSPGDGLTYRIVAIPIQELDCGILGRVEPGWLIVNGNNGNAHLFADTGYLSAGYVAEKLYGVRNRGQDDFIDEVQCITALIGFAIGRETSVKQLHLKE